MIHLKFVVFFAICFIILTYYFLNLAVIFNMPIKNNLLDDNNEQISNGKKAISFFVKYWPKQHQVTEFGIDEEKLPIKVPKEFEETFKMSAIDIFAGNNAKDLLLFTMFNRAFINMTLNWNGFDKCQSKFYNLRLYSIFTGKFLNFESDIYQIHRLCNVEVFNGIHRRLLLVGIGNGACELITIHWSKVVCLQLNMNTDQYNEPLNWGRQSYVSFLAIRAQLMLNLAEMNITFVLFETDAVWFRDPLDYFKESNLIDDVDIVTPIKGYPDHSRTLAFDPMLVYPTENTFTFLRYFTKKLMSNRSIFDQDLLNHLCKRMYMGLRCRTFPWEDISDGLWFKFPEKERDSFRPFIVNNNFYVGVDNKISRQALNGFWFLTVKRKCRRKRVISVVNKNGGKLGITNID